MMESTVRVDETISQSAGRVSEISYVYTETQANGTTTNYNVTVKRQEYERLAKELDKITLPFDSFTQVLRPFMMGKYASEDIPKAFKVLDTDHSGTIDIGELAAFMPVIVPNANPYMLLHHVQKADKNGDYKLDLNEFTDLINRGVGRDITLGRL
jgi:Ca2+-binding EF-hand superfamily protein